MLYHNIKLRHELKYYISDKEYHLLRARLAPIMRLDENTTRPEGYCIRSLYFDDMYDTAVMEKLTGGQRRDKYRVRVYNGSDHLIRLERKSKYDAYIAKASESITRAQLEAMLDGDYSPLLAMGTPLARDVYAKRQTVLLRPAVIVDYLREAYVYPAGNVRVTFDKDVRAGYGNYDIFSGRVLTCPVVEAGQMVLEIKYDDFLPDVIRRLVRSINGDYCAISKYVMCRIRLSEIKTNARRVVLSING